MKIAILMGNRLNEWHLAPYEKAASLSSSKSPLEMTAFVPTDNLFAIKSSQVAIRIIPYEYEAGSLWNRLSAKLKYRILHQRAGYEFMLHGLEEALQGFDLIQSWELFTTQSLASVRAASHGNARTLITVWDDIAHDLEHLPCKAVIKSEVRSRAHGFLVYTDAARQALIEEGVAEKKIHRILPSVDLARFQSPLPIQDRDFQQWQEGRFLVMYAGRLVREKGIFDLLDAAEPLMQKHPERKLSLVYLGSGTEESPLKEEIFRRGLQDTVRIISRKPNAEMPAWLHRTDLLVLPSRPRKDWREQFGMIALEALAAGSPVIASRTPGMEEMLGDAAVLFEPTNVVQLRDCIEHLMLSPEVRQQLSDTGQTRAAEYFDLNRNARKLLALYEQLMRIE